MFIFIANYYLKTPTTPHTYSPMQTNKKSIKLIFIQVHNITIIFYTVNLILIDKMCLHFLYK